MIIRLTRSCVLRTFLIVGLMFPKCNGIDLYCGGTVNNQTLLSLYQHHQQNSQRIPQSNLGVLLLENQCHNACFSRRQVGPALGNLACLVAEFTSRRHDLDANGDGGKLDRRYQSLDDLVGGYQRKVLDADLAEDQESNLRFSRLDDEDGVVGDNEFGQDDSLTMPLAYRYYRRSVNKQSTALSIPFLFLGPNVDHWKQTAQELAAAGFSAIACERIKEDDESSVGSGKNLDTEELRESACSQTVIDLLDALRWSRAVIVACDSETVMAIQAALHLSPHRIVGLVLCGNLDSAYDYIERIEPKCRKTWGVFSVDQFLRQFLHCPSIVVWDGDRSWSKEQMASGVLTTQRAAHMNALANERVIVKGSGAAPHRRQPEYLSWILTRFVEERVAPWRPQDQRSYKREKNSRRADDSRGSKSYNFLRDEVSDFFSEEGMLVFGRLVAKAIFYGTAIRVGFYQYNNFRNGIFDFQTKLSLIASAPGKLFALIAGIFAASPQKTSNTTDLVACRTIAETDFASEDIWKGEEKKNQTEGGAETVEPRDTGNSTTLTIPENKSNNDERDDDNNDDDDDRKWEDDEDEPSTQEREPKPDALRPIFFLDNVIA